MKKLTTALLGATLLLSPAAFAQNEQQQLPNNGFEEVWGDCMPWTSVNSTKTQGQNPASWCISNVAGIQGGKFMTGSGAVSTGEKVTGFNSNSAVKIFNALNPVTLLGEKIVPGYLTLGTTWSTSETGKSNDGGTFDGYKFTSRPDAIEFMYKRDRSTSKPEEVTTIIAYLWKGTWTQEDVPGNIAMGAATKCKMTNRDRCVLLSHHNYMSDGDFTETELADGSGYEITLNGNKSTLGGKITRSKDAELIGVAEITLTDNKSEWTNCHVDFKYYSDNTPDMINVIFAAGDYFGGDQALGKDNSLYIDDVKLIYYPRINHEGYLNIEMFGSKIATDDVKTITIVSKSDELCDFLLPEFVLDMQDGNGPQLLGDIAVPNVVITKENGVNNYEGSVKGLSLAGGEIVADADVKGTIDADNNVNMEIPVTWNGIPINVTFSSARKNAPEVPSILLDGVAPEGDNFDAANKEITFPEVKDVEIYYSLKEGSTTTEPANAPAKVPAGYTKYDGNPLTIEANKQYTLTYIAKDTKTGLESEPKTVSFSTTVGIAAIEAENGTAEYFTLQGVRVAEPTNGIYIRVANGKASKVTVK